MGTAKGAVRLGCIAIVVMVIAQIVISLTAPYWLAPLIGVYGAAVEASSEQMVDWYGSCQGGLGCAVLILTILWLLVGPVNVQLRRSRKPVAPQGDTLTSLAIRGWRNRDDSGADSD